MSLAEQALRQRESHLAFADPVRSGKQQGVTQPTAARGVAKHRDLVGMADNGMPRGRHNLRLTVDSDCRNENDQGQQWCRSPQSAA
jgi:hypothetical protein